MNRITENKTIKSLMLASILALGINSAYANDLAPVPKTAESNPQGTLDKLAGQPIPNTDPVQYYPSDGSAYTLTKVQEGGNKPAGDNIVTQFDYDKQNYNVTPVYYRLDLKQTTYGEGNSVKYYGWTKDENGNRTFGEVEQTNADITVKYNDLSGKKYNTEYKDTNYEAEVTTGGSSSAHKQEIHSALQNNSGNTITIDNAIFKDNSTVIDFNKSSNSSSTNYLEVVGGGLYNAGTIEKITADFVNNSITANITGSYGSTYADGGAIYNSNSIGDITGDFIGNYAQGSGSADGGAIYNYGTIGDITGNFIGNYASGSYTYTYAYGGAIYNKGEIGNITGDFIGNHASSVSSAYGGTITNWGAYVRVTIDSITGDFIGNFVSSDSLYANGGAIYNYASNGEYAIIGNITGDFIGNYASSVSYYAYGGAICNDANTVATATISDIKGNFIGNYASSVFYYAYGGAIYNHSTINNILGDFIGNYAQSSRDAYGGAIYNAASGNSGNARIDNLTGDFIGNYVSSDSRYAEGGAICNSGDSATIRNITGDFINNYAQGKIAEGGAIANNRGKSGGITGDFIGNYAQGGEQASGGAIYNYTTTTGDITGNFIGNYVQSTYGNALGGAIYNSWNNYYGTVETKVNITGDFIENYAQGEQAAGGAIANVGGTINSITGDFVGNYVYTKKAQNLYDNNSVQTYQAVEEPQPEIGALGGAIANIDGEIGEIRGSFINNYAASEEGDAKGGAIYSNTDITIVADNGNQIAFSGNYTESNGVKDDNAIYLDNAESTLTFKLAQGGSVYMKDNIDGAVNTKDGISQNYNVDIQGDNKDNTTFYMLNDIRNADVTVGNTTLNTVNNQTHVYDFNSFALTGDTNFIADVDLTNSQMDRITANSYGTHNGNLNVIGMNMLSDAPEDREVTEIYFAQQGLKDNVVNGVEETPTSYQTTAYTPIYKYNVMYDNREDAGYFLFTKGDKIFVPGGDGGTTVTPTPGGNASNAFNPSVLSSPVAAQAGAYAAQNATFNYAFQHADTFMPLPATERFALKNANRYAITGYDKLEAVDNEFHNKAIWVRPYTSFENIPLKNGPKVDTITYGTLIGGDSDFKELRNGWGTIFTGYIGYNGSSQSYSGVNTYQNGGLVGATQTFYKGNFFTALTASAGASAGESHNMYGNENFSTLMAGVANKSGYNIEFKEGKFIIQPTLMLAYSFINTFDYTNSAGVKISSDPLHAIQINPNVKFIGNLKNGWQPYASVGMVWNILDDTKVMANDVRLPEMSVKPYVEYGVGIQKRWKDRCTGYLQAMIRNGGRNGIVLTGGFRWAIGKEGKPIEKVSNPQNKTAQASNNDRKILKQLSPAQRTALGAKPQNTTRTSCIGEVK